MEEDLLKIEQKGQWNRYVMKINRAYKYELKPNKAQSLVLAKHAGVARFAYNWALSQRIYIYEKDKKKTNAIEQHRILNALKQTEFPWMYEVSKCAPQEALRDLDRAFQNFFKGLKSGKKFGYPSFKKKGKKDSFRLTGTIKVQEKAVQLPRLGTIRLKEEANVKGKILSASVSKEADRWYVSICVEMEKEEPVPVIGEKIGIDLGLTHFATYSNGKKIKAPKPLSKKLKQLKRASRKHSRKQKGSNNRKKSSIKLSKVHRKIRNQRKDFLHKETTKLAKTKSIIVLEDLDVKSLLEERSLSRQISDVGWSEFRRMLEYKTKWYGSTLKIISRYYPSSKLCSNCEYRLKELPLNQRGWECPSCKCLHDRDVNAAINILNNGTGSSPGIYACGDSSYGANNGLLVMGRRSKN